MSYLFLCIKDDVLSTFTFISHVTKALSFVGINDGVLFHYTVT